MNLKFVAGKAALNVVVSVTLLVAGVTGGVAYGMLQGTASPPPAGSTNRIASFNEPVQHFAMAGIIVQEATVAPAARKTVRKVVTQTAAGRSGDAAGGVGGGTAGTTAAGGAANAAGERPCSSARLDDKKVNWLIGLVGKAEASNPDQAAVADRAEASLRSALGKNLCADEAQLHFDTMCADAATKRFMGLMVKELPFFVRPLVGDPCGHDLVAAAEKWLP
ncbi:MAG TPA: hypothetical protein VHJ78_03590 [Actinomycetota bacterium]|nr:hypothetical protein [Actinomycetota bacterium]